MEEVAFGDPKGPASDDELDTEDVNPGNSKGGKLLPRYDANERSGNGRPSRSGSPSSVMTVDDEINSSGSSTNEGPPRMISDGGGTPFSSPKAIKEPSMSTKSKQQAKKRKRSF